MSVLIKGMTMPTSCLKGGCHLDGFACQLWEDKYWSNSEGPEKWRHRDCPLIELPDHGDLIDRDGLRKQIPSEEMASKFAIENAYVVIPAERSEG